MIGLRVAIDRFVEEGQPNVVECSFVDAYGNRHQFLEKVPVVSAEDLDATSEYPQDALVACEVIRTKRHEGLELIEIDTSSVWGIWSDDGRNCFDVLPEQLVEE